MAVCVDDKILIHFRIIGIVGAKIRKKFLLSILFIKLLRTITNKVCLRFGADFCTGGINVPRIWGKILHGWQKRASDLGQTSARGVEICLGFGSDFCTGGRNVPEIPFRFYPGGIFMPEIRFILYPGGG